jgi:hypothetical protein
MNERPPRERFYSVFFYLILFSFTVVAPGEPAIVSSAQCISRRSSKHTSPWCLLSLAPL